MSLSFEMEIPIITILVPLLKGKGKAYLGKPIKLIYSTEN